MDFPSPPVLNLTIVSYVLYPAVYLSSRPYVGPALDMAADRLRHLYNFNVTVEYVGSNNWSTVQGMMDNVYLVSKFYEETWDQNGVVVSLTPGTTEVSLLGDIAREEDSLILTTSFPVEGLQDRRRYPTMISTAPVQMQAYPEVLFAVMQEFSWSSVCAIRDLGAASPFYYQWLDAARSIVRGRSDRILLNVQYINCTGGTHENFTEMFSAALRQCSKISRILVLSMRGDAARNILVQASNMRMTNGEYVYFVMEPLRNARFFGGISNFSSGNASSSETDAILQGYRNLFKISPCRISDTSRRNQSSSLRNLMTEWRRRSKIDYNFDYIPEEQPNEFVTAVYEAVDVLGQILRKSVRENASMSGRSLASRALNHSFSGELREIFVDKYGERKSLHCVTDFVVSNKTFKNVMVYSTSEQRFTVLDRDQIDWSGSMGPPPNEPRCGYSGDRCDTTRQRIATTVGSTIGAAACVFLAFLLVFLLHNRNQNRATANWWQMEREGFCSLRRPSENYRPFPTRRQSTLGSATLLSHRFSEKKSFSRKRLYQRSLFTLI